VLCAKGVIKTAAERRGKSATFMPKALSGSPGCGLRINAGLVKDGKSRFFDKRGWAGASQMLLHFVGGLLAHVDSLLAICAPSANSFARFAAMDEPLYVAFGPSHAATLVAVDSPGEGKPPQLEFRGADLSANPYLAFAALLCAGVDGMLRSIDPISAGFGPLEGDIASGPGASAAPRKAAANLGAALDALEREGAYLSDGDVFGTGLLRRWSEARRAELRALATRPHPYEFAQSYEC
jgi:glutamine synthetase